MFQEKVDCMASLRIVHVFVLASSIFTRSIHDCLVRVLAVPTVLHNAGVRSCLYIIQLGFCEVADVEGIDHTWDVDAVVEHMAVESLDSIVVDHFG